ncbi:MAG: chain length determinant protein EpsF [Burkholderiales bacterium]|nr:chain length determinant protein EpsF [Burkholderiales bacterium]
MSFGQILAILRARWVVLAAIISLTLLVTLVVSFLLPKQYTATAAVVIDVKSPDPVAGMVLPGVMMPSYLATQVDLIQSERVALRVVNALKLTDSTKLRDDWMKEGHGEGSFEVWIAELIGKNLTVTPSRESNVINFSYNAVDSGFAASLANAYVEAYINATGDLRVEPAKKYGATFENLASQLRARLEVAQNKLAAYQKETGLLATDARLDVETARLNDLSQQVVLLQATRSDAETRKISAAHEGSDNTADAMNSSLISGLKVELARAEAQLEQYSSRLGDAHPSVIDSKASVASLRGRLRTELNRLAGSYGTTSSVTQSKLAEATVALEKQRAKLLALNQQRNDAAVLLRDVENLQKGYDAVQARVMQATVESNTMQTNLSVLKYASKPTKPSSPKIFLNGIIALFLGSIVAMATVLGIELIDRRIRTNFEILHEFKLPVLGVMLKTDNAAPRALLGLIRS